MGNGKKEEVTIIVQSNKEKYDTRFPEIEEAPDTPIVTEIKGVAIVEELITKNEDGIIIRSVDENGQNYLMQISGKILWHLMGEYSVAEEKFKEGRKKKR